MVETELLMRCLAVTARAAARDLAHAIEPEGLFGAEWAILAVLHRSGPASQAALAAGLAIEPPAISKALARMEGRGWVQRRAGPTRREHRVALTAEAEARFARCSEGVRAHHARALAGLTPEDVEQLHHLLSRVRANLRPAPGDAESG